MDRSNAKIRIGGSIDDTDKLHRVCDLAAEAGLTHDYGEPEMRADEIYEMACEAAREGETLTLISESGEVEDFLKELRDLGLSYSCHGEPGQFAGFYDGFTPEAGNKVAKVDAEGKAYLTEEDLDALSVEGLGDIAAWKEDLRIARGDSLSGLSFSQAPSPT